MLKYPENLTHVQLNSLQTPYCPVQVDHTHKSQHFVTQLRIEARIVFCNFIDFLRRIDLDDLKAWIRRF